MKSFAINTSASVYLKLETIVLAFLTLMCVQIVIIEGMETSYVKVVAMLLMSAILFIRAFYLSRALVLGMCYLLALTMSIMFNIETFRLETVLYRFAAVIAFISFYNLVYCKHVLTYKRFLTFVKGMIYAYAIVLVVQQLCRVVLGGNAIIPLLNLHASLERSILATGSLSIEPSHSARILGGLAIVLLRLYECKWGEGKVSLRILWKECKWCVVAFLWAMLTMSSGTAVVVLAIIALYFFKRVYALIGIALVMTFNTVAPQIDYEPVQRVYKTLNAMTTLDRGSIQEADLSASARVLPYIYTYENFDLKKKETWIGHGIDTGVKNDIWGTRRMIGDMTDYGFIQYVFVLMLIFSCCIRRFFSIETLFFIIVLMAEARNVYVWWAVFMLFAASRYFLLKKKVESY